MNLHKYLYILFLTFFPFICTAQSLKSNSIHGTVHDSAYRQPLQGANVLLINTNYVALTDKNGKFEFKSVTPGEYTIRVKYIGYQTYQKKIKISEAQKIVLNIELQDSIITSKVITVEAQRPGNIYEKTLRVNSITSEDIKESPLQNISSIIDYVPGVSIYNTTGIYSSKTNVTMRGLPGNDQSRTLVIMDGVVLNKADLGSVNWNLISKNNIEDIKIIKGPGPAKYGSGAMGGVIEITTKKPSDKTHGDISLSYGTYNTISSEVDVSGGKKLKKGSLYWGISGTGKLSDGYITEPEQFIEKEDSILVPVYLKEAGTDIKAGYAINSNQNIEVQHSFYDDLRSTGVKVFEDLGAYSRHKTNRSLVKYRGNSKNWRLDVIGNYSAENYNRMYEYMKEGEYSLYEADSKREDGGVDLNLTYTQFARHEIAGGISYKQGSVDGADTYYTSTDIVNNGGKISGFSLYLQDGMTLLSKRLTLNAGIRYDLAKFTDGFFNIEDPSYTIIFYEDFENKDISTKTWDAVNPRLSLRYNLSGANSIYMSFAKGFRAPVLDDMCRTGKKKGGFKVANPDLGPESIYTYEAGSDIKILNGLTASLSAYYSTGKDFMYYTSTGDTVNMGYKLAPVFSKQNIGKVEIYGAESELKYEFSSLLSCFLNYSYTHATIKEHEVTNAKVDSNLTGKYLTDIPDHKITAGITLKSKFINAVLLYKYTGKVWINDYNSVDTEYLLTDRYPDYSIFNLRFSKNILKKWQLSINIENIFNKIYIDGDVQRNPGRFITGTVKYTF